MKQFKAWPLGSPGFSNYAKSRIQLVESDEYNGPPSLDTLVLLTEAIFPSSLHEDPRFFRCGTGSGWSRLKYAVGQIFIAHTDSGEKQFNVSEFGETRLRLRSRWPTIPRTAVRPTQYQSSDYKSGWMQ